MKIGEVAARSGLAASRIRFYEAAGLLGRTKRRANGYREFPPEVLEHLELITKAQEAGFSLEDVKSFLSAGKTRHDEATLATLKKKVAEIDALRARLRRTKARLLSIIDSIENKPKDVACEENAERIMMRIRGARLSRMPTKRDHGKGVTTR